ncbi:hypothetical protein [Micromonospora sp. NPDC047074]|uniref:hypothetical protein n=1 Tax=Micromonospora sp. NPDC047074 TaxID=3154339 RepID=UPI00340DA765
MLLIGASTMFVGVSNLWDWFSEGGDDDLAVGVIFGVIGLLLLLVGWMRSSQVDTDPPD